MRGKTDRSKAAAVINISATMSRSIILLYYLIFNIIIGIDSHAIFWEPPSRASLGKHNNNFCHVPINNDHMSLYCGGITVQHETNGGKCGVCGDPYHNIDQPHRYPGKYATGIIGRSYPTPGQVCKTCFIKDYCAFSQLTVS